MQKRNHHVAALVCVGLVIILRLLGAVSLAEAAETSTEYSFAALNVALPDGQFGFTTLEDINDESQVTGGYTNSNLGPYGFVLDLQRRRVRLSRVRCPGKKVVSTAPQAINRWGEIAGFASVVVDVIRIPEPPGKIPITETKGFFRDKAGKCTLIEIPGANLTEATGINDAGQVVGDYRDSTTGLFRGFIWSAGNLQSIEVPNAALTAPTGINSLGEIVGFFFDSTVSENFPNGRVRGFKYHNETFTHIDFPDALSTQPMDINDNGKIVGGFSLVDELSSFVLSDDTFTVLNAPFADVVITDARGINNQGQIVGRYVTSDPTDPVNPFLSHGFVASPNVTSSAVVAKPRQSRSLINEAKDPHTSDAGDVNPPGHPCIYDETAQAALVSALIHIGLCAAN